MEEKDPTKETKQEGSVEGGGKIRREQCPGSKVQVLPSKAIELSQEFKINQLQLSME